ncbi:hypothetical protein D3C73_793360 [compost metagenome]
MAARVILHLLEGEEILHRRVGPGQVHLALGGHARRVAQVVEILDAVGLPIQIEAHILRSDVDRIARGVEGGDREVELLGVVVADGQQHDRAGWPVRHHQGVAAREANAHAVIGRGDHPHLLWRRGGAGSLAVEVGHRIARGPAQVRQQVAAQALAVLAVVGAEGGAQGPGGQLQHGAGHEGLQGVLFDRHLLAQIGADIVRGFRRNGAFTEQVDGHAAGCTRGRIGATDGAVGTEFRVEAVAQSQAVDLVAAVLLLIVAAVAGGRLPGPVAPGVAAQADPTAQGVASIAGVAVADLVEAARPGDALGVGGQVVGEHLIGNRRVASAQIGATAGNAAERLVRLKAGIGVEHGHGRVEGQADRLATLLSVDP